MQGNNPYQDERRSRVPINAKRNTRALIENRSAKNKKTNGKLTSSNVPVKEERTTQQARYINPRTTYKEGVKVSTDKERENPQRLGKDRHQHRLTHGAKEKLSPEVTERERERELQASTPNKSTNVGGNRRKKQSRGGDKWS